MRILNLRLKNLNSLVGEWEIDFTHPEFLGNSLFAIMGPTGSGKSTILDAICLALYGRTPRLDKITQSSNELMSRQTGECLAEVTFETAEGVFRCFWSQHCARKKSGEALQKPIREVVDHQTQVVLENNLNKVQEQIEKLTGMDFQRFTRSMMLAQGGFDAFLKAATAEKAAILQQITGTEIYSEISIKVFERAKQEKDQLEKLTIELSSIQALTTEMKGQYLLEQEEGVQKVLSLSKSFEQLTALKNWRTEMDEAATQKSLLESALELIMQEEILKQEDFRKLAASLKALDYEKEHFELSSLQADQNRDRQSIVKGLSLKEETVKNLNEVSNQLNLMRKNYESLMEEKKVIDKQLLIVRELDSNIVREEKELNELHTSQKKTGHDFKLQEEALKSLKNDIERIKSSRDAIEVYFENHKDEGSLVEQFSFIKEKLAQLKTWNRTLFDVEKSVLKLTEQQSAIKKSWKDLEERTKDERLNYSETEKSFKVVDEEVLKKSEGKDAFQWNELNLNYMTKLTASEGIAVKLEKREQNLLKVSSIKNFINLANHQKNEFEEVLDQELNTLKEYDQKIEVSEARWIAGQKIESMQSSRECLVDGQPCPLCGSEDHPYLADKLPILTEAEKELLGLKRERKKFEEGRFAHKELAKKLAEIASLETTFKELLSSCEGAIEGEATLAEHLTGLKFLKLEKFDFDTRYQNYLKKLDERDTLYKRLKLAQEAQIEFDLEEKKWSREVQKIDHSLSNLVDQKTKLNKDLLELVDHLKELLRPYKIFNLQFQSDESLEEVKLDLSTRLDNWKHQLASRVKLEKDQHEIDLKLGTLQSQQEFIKHNLDILNQSVQTKSALLEEKLKLRFELFGKKIADLEQKRIDSLVEVNIRDLDLIKDKQVKLIHTLEAYNARLRELEDQINKQSVDLLELEKLFILNISKEGFKNIQEFQQASLPKEEREKLRLSKTELELKKRDLLTRLNLIKEKMAMLGTDLKTEKSAKELASELDLLHQEIEKLKDSLSKIKMVLEENLKKEEQSILLQDKIFKQRKENEVWSVLKDLIGSADGKKFMNFAQKMTLEMMIAHANRQLMKMSGRYLLKQSKDFPLELEVIDNYQGGEERSVKNLSGGESFIVSLALALGLSQMASKKVRVDSLFLDEGFGTLDEKALEVALDALGQLQQEGKVIGLISHVSSLKERINTQIIVTPLTGGKSRIDGPGCLSK